MKKIITLFLSFVFLLGALGVMSVYAADAVTLSVSSESAYRGDTVSVTVSVTANSGFAFLMVTPSYDETALTLVETVNGDVCGSMTAGKNPNWSGNGQNVTATGTLVTFKFTVKDSAAVGDYTVGLTVRQCYDAASQSVNVQAGSGKITVACKHEYENSCDKDCDLCGAERSITHTWDSGKVTTEATCTAQGTKTYTCKVCGETKTESVAKKSHKYNNDCDTDCNTCGEKRTVTHSYKTAWSSDGSSHWHVCSVCGDVKDKAAHTPGAEATEWSAQTCTVCGYTIKAALGHTHTYGTVWTYDESGHWHACGGCDVHGDAADHDFDNDCDADCNTCGYTREVTHSYGEDWVRDETSHWHECAVCGAAEEAAEHAFADGVCAECGMEEGQEPSTEPSQEPTEGTTDGCSHNWGEGVVTREATEAVPGVITYTCGICGETKTESIPSLSAGMEVDYQFPWWLVGVIAGILLLGLALYVILGLIGAKKQKGKYTK